LAKDNKKSDDDLFDDLMDKYQACEDFYSEVFERGEEDMNFLYGVNQWDAKAEAQRKLEGRPCLTLNQLLPYAKQVVNDIRQSRPAIRVSPVDSNADIDTADVFAGLIRNIEKQSKASNAYDTAAMNGVGGGMGWVRVCVDYSNPMTFDQEIYIDRVLNFQSAMLDPAHKRLDGSDAEYGFIIDEYTKEEFEDKWPDADVSSFKDYAQGWAGDKTVRVAECYYKDYETVTITRVKYTQDGIEADGVLLDSELAIFKENGVDLEIIDERETRIVKVKQCLLSGKEILSKAEWMGQYIPLIPVVGEEVYLNGRRSFHSLIRQAKDPQRMYNYWETMSTEIIALQPKSPWTAPVGSFTSYPDQWLMANVSNLPFLEYDMVYDDNGQRAERPMREQPIQGSPAIMQQSMNAREGIRLALGMPQASMGEDGREISGIAIRNRQLRGDNATFHFIDNLATAITHVGVILVDLIPKIYKGAQIKRILGEDGTDENIPINQPYVKDEQGNLRPAKPMEKYDGIYRLDAGKYDVVCDIGASYSSQRQEMADKLSELLNAQPDLVPIIGDLAIEALDLPMAKEIAERLRANMNPALLGNDPQAAKLQEASKMVQQLEEQLQNMDAALQDKKKDAQFEQSYKMQELELERQKALVDAEKTRAEIMKIQSEINGGANQTAQAMNNIGGVVQDLMSRVDDMTQAFEILLDSEEQNMATGEPIQSPVSAMESVPNE
jgi:hypothetical protein